MHAAREYGRGPVAAHRPIKGYYTKRFGKRLDIEVDPRWLRVVRPRKLPAVFDALQNNGSRCAPALAVGTLVYQHRESLPTRGQRQLAAALAVKEDLVPKDSNEDLDLGPTEEPASSLLT